MKPTKTKLRCISAATRYYQVGKEYTVYQNGDGINYVQGSDGFYDNVAKMSSKFMEVEGEAKQRQSKGT